MHIHKLNYKSIGSQTLGTKLCNIHPNSKYVNAIENAVAKLISSFYFF